MKYSTQILAGLALASSLHAQGFKTSEFSYMAGQANGDFNYEPIVTVGDRVPLTGDASKSFAMSGIPDASGIYRDRVSGEIILFCAHEVGQTVQSTVFPGETPLIGAFVSRYVLNSDGSVKSGNVAYTQVFKENALWGDTPRTGARSAFTRFCSGSFAGPQHGFDRPMFLTVEETFGSAQFSTKKGLTSAGVANTGADLNSDGDGLGAQAVAVFDGKMHTLPALGRIGRETTIVQPRRDSKTVIISTEDAGAPSYVYMYVGTKLRRSASGLDKNGLTNGETYVLCSSAQHDNEGTFTTSGGTLPISWRLIPNAKNLSDAQLLTAAAGIGAFGFHRVEDADFDPLAPTRSMFFASTGGGTSNVLSRLYQVSMDPVNPTANGSMTMIYNADQIVTPGGTYAGARLGSLVDPDGTTGPLLSPGSMGTYSGGVLANGVDFAMSVDNISVTKDFIVLQEDRATSAFDTNTAFHNRNGAIWTLDRNNGFQAKLQSDFNYAQIQARDGHGPLTRGLWESSGVIPTDEFFGAGSFVTFVQAHSQTNVYPAGTTENRSIRTNIPDGNGGVLTRTQARAQFREDGQILIMRPKQPN